MSVFCNQCGYKIENAYKFCPSCGTPIVELKNIAQENNERKENEFMKYKKTNDGKEIFCLYVALGEDESAKKVEVEYAKGNGARLCKNAVIAMEQLENDGYAFKNVEIVMTLSEEMDINDENCEVISPEVIAKLYEAKAFFEIMGYSLRWMDLSALFHCVLSEFSKIEMVDILKKVMEQKLGMEFPTVKNVGLYNADTSVETPKNTNLLREGEVLLLHQDFYRSMDWYKKDFEYNDDRDGYTCNIIGQLYLRQVKSVEGQINRDSEHAKEWLKRSADRDNLLGVLNLGLMYEEGIGTERNIELALDCYLKAYKTGNEIATNNFNRFLELYLVDIYEKGRSIECDYELTVLADKCEKKAENSIDVYVLNTGYMYHHGIGRPISIPTAIDYYKKLLVYNARSCSEEKDRYCSYAIKFLEEICNDGYGSVVKNASAEQVLKNVVTLEIMIKDYEEEKQIVKLTQFDEVEPKRPTYQDWWVVDGSVRYDDNICFSEAELQEEQKIYKGLLDSYNAFKDNWKKKQDLLLAELEKKITEAKNSREKLQDSLNNVIPLEHQDFDEMIFICDYIQSTSVTIEEALWTYHRESFYSPNEMIMDEKNCIISGGDGFYLVKPITEELSEIIEKEKQIKQLVDEDNRLKKGEPLGKKPVKPACKSVIHKDAPANHYKGHICVTVDQYKYELEAFFNEYKEYHLKKLQWIGIQAQKRVELKHKKDALQKEVWELYRKLKIPKELRNQKAMEIIHKHMVSSKCTLEEAFNEYDRQQRIEKESEKRELERRRQLEAEQEQIRLENARHNKERLDREYEEQEAAYERRQMERYNERESSSSRGGSFLRDVAATAIGTSLGNRGIKKELKKHWQEEKQREREREKERRWEESRKKREAASRSQVEWENVRKANEERRRKGLPELPYPDRFYW